MRSFFVCLLAVLATPVTAHPGHLAELAGHGHLLGAAALAAAIALGLLAAKGAKAKPEQDQEDEQEEELQEA
ncbi:MAG: DUF6732 family protein [Pseudomonadota bacterium]